MSLATRSLLFVGALALCFPLLAQEAERERSAGPELQAFLGSWELDEARTKPGSTSVTYEQAGDSIRATTPVGTYTFKIDGTEYKTMLPGDTISWKQLDKNTLESTRKHNAKPESISTRVFSPDGKTITVTTKMMGDHPSTTTTRMERTSPSAGGQPLIGTWESRTEGGLVGRITYTRAPGGLHMRYEGMMPQEYTLVFDGKPHAVESLGPDQTLTARKINERTIEEQWTRDGKPLTTSTITVSADGQELVEHQQFNGPHTEPSDFVYHRAK
jgi:hypothetical protein